MKKFFKKFKNKKVWAVITCVIAIMSTFCIPIGASSPLTGGESVAYKTFDFEKGINASYNNGAYDLRANYKVIIDGEECTITGYTIKGGEGTDQDWVMYVTGYGTTFDEELGQGITEIARFNASTGAYISHVPFYFTDDLSCKDEYNAMSTLEIIEVEKQSDNVGILNVFGGIATWIPSAIGIVISLFWVNNSLTFFGILAVAGLAVAVVLLIVNLVRNFIEFRG